MNNTKPLYQQLDNQPMADFSLEDDLAIKKLKAPIRHVEFRFGDILCRIPRGADDQTPDDVVMIGGIYLNLTDGRIGKSVASVNSHHKQKSPEKK